MIMHSLVSRFRRLPLLRGLVYATLSIAPVLLLAGPAAAQWRPVANVPAVDVFTLRAKGDTLLAGTFASMFISTDGVNWQPSAGITSGRTGVFAAAVHHRKLYAGTGGQGVLVSTDMGQNWTAFNEGLVGGLFESQLQISELLVRGDSLYASTFGAGVYVRKLSGVSAWSHFGEVFEGAQAANVASLSLGGSRLVACAGGNGTVFVRDPGAPDWTESLLGNDRLLAGVGPQSAFWTGSHWVVGSNLGIFVSATGLEPWTRVVRFPTPAGGEVFAQMGGVLFGAFDFPNEALIARSLDGGFTWEVIEDQPGVYVYDLAVHGQDLYAAREDGLWILPAATASVPDDQATSGLHFALAGPQPIGDQVRFTFVLAETGVATIEVLDVQGRVVIPRMNVTPSLGQQEVLLDTHSLEPGVYLARLSAGGTSAVSKLVRAR